MLSTSLIKKILYYAITIAFVTATIWYTIKTVTGLRKILIIRIAYFYT